MTFEIKKGVALPPRHLGNGKGVTMALRQMEVGDCVENAHVGYPSAHKARSSWQVAASRLAISLRTEIRDGVLRVWRVG